ncbi:hypothetical protein FRB95_003613 [Tulasnella sp. JGI-2019a]|nr:hypothetical protein FRB93_008107 [Tulasnella sp. JGI-2019a]KAG9030711.1 hypothetical protein FRB95_003613 [Tulasnella sp. JGI-2019a]
MSDLLKTEMPPPGDEKIDRSITILLEAVHELYMSKSHSVGEKRDPLDEIYALDACFNKFTAKMHQIIANSRRSYNANLPIY